MTHRNLYQHFSTWNIVDTGLAKDAQSALAQDSEILRDVANGRGGPVLRIWEAPKSLIVTRKEKHFSGFADACLQLAAQGWPVVLRDSGGTAIPLQPGILNLSMIFPQQSMDEFNVEEVYQALCEPIRLCLLDHGLQAEYGKVPGSYCDGRYNLKINELKVTGTAIRMMLSTNKSVNIKQGVLAQAMLMVEGNAAALTEKVNDVYRLTGQVTRFDPRVSTSLSEALGKGMSCPELTAQVRQQLLSHLQQLSSN